MRALTLAFASLSLVACGGNVSSADSAASQSLNGGGQPPPVSTCTPDVSNLLAGQTIDAGSVSLTSDGESLLIDIATDGGWQLAEVHVWAGTGTPPSNKQGVVVPGQFPYKATFSPMRTSYSLAISLASLNVGCGDDLKAVVHTVVKKVVNGAVVDTQTGFGDGTPFASNRWGFTMNYTVCCGDEVCTNEDAATWHDTAGSQWPEFSPSNTFCYAPPPATIPTFGDILASYSDDPFTNLAREFVAAKLNKACTPWDGTVGPAMVAALYILNDCAVSESELAEALALTATLHAYNAL